MANRLHSDLLAVFVETPFWARATPEERQALEANLRFAEELGAKVIRTKGPDVSAELVRVAKERNVGSIIVGQSSHGWLHGILHGSVAQRLLGRVRDVDVHVVAQHDDQARRML